MLPPQQLSEENSKSNKELSLSQDATNTNDSSTQREENVENMKVQFKSRLYQLIDKYTNELSKKKAINFERTLTIRRYIQNTSTVQTGQVAIHSLNWADICQVVCVHLGLELHLITIALLDEVEGEVVVPDWFTLGFSRDSIVVIVRDRVKIDYVGEMPPESWEITKNNNDNAAESQEKKKIHSRALTDDKEKEIRVQQQPSGRNVFNSLNTSKAQLVYFLINFLVYLALILFQCFAAIALQDPQKVQTLGVSLGSPLNSPSYLSVRNGQPIRLVCKKNASTIFEFWDWVNGPLSVFLTETNAGSGFPPDSSVSASWRDSSNLNQIFGAVRLRQFRVFSFKCGAPNHAQPCYYPYQPSVANVSTYGRAPQTPGFVWKSFSGLSVYGDLATYDSSGFVLSVGNQSNWRGELLRLTTNGWLDAATRAVLVELSIINSNLDSQQTFGASVKYLAEVSQTGVLFVSSQISPFQFHTASSTQQTTYYVLDSLSFALVTALCVKLLFFAYHFHSPHETIAFMRRHSFSLVFDAVVAALFYAAFGLTLSVFSSQSALLANPSNSTNYVAFDGVAADSVNALRVRAALILVAGFQICGMFASEFILGLLLEMGKILACFAPLFVGVVVMGAQILPNFTTGNSFLNSLRVTANFVTGNVEEQYYEVMFNENLSESGFYYVYVLFVLFAAWLVFFPFVLGFTMYYYEVLG